MTTLTRLLGEYAADHQHPTNRLLHSICVPAIVLSIAGLLWAVPVPAPLERWIPGFNWGLIGLIALAIGYLVASVRLGAGAALACFVSTVLLDWLDSLPGALWPLMAGLFIIAWIGQFVGHSIEGRRPSFLRDLRFLLVGPLWVLAGLYGKLGIRYQVA